jgi:hypothetical protein
LETPRWRQRKNDEYTRKNETETLIDSISPFSLEEVR